MRSARRRPLPLVTVVVVIAMALAACGLSSEEEATRLPAAEVPFGLLQPADTTLPRQGPDTVPVALYFVKGDHLEPVIREVRVEATPDLVLEAMLAGPTRAEAADGLVTRLSDPQSIAGVSVSRGVATVDLAPSPAVRSDDQPLALAQVVFTLTAQPGIGRVAFTIDGEPVEVPDGTGALTSAAVAREDFSALAPPSA